MEIVTRTDKQIACIECGRVFIFTADEQAWFAEKGLVNERKRCRECKRAKTRRFRSLGLG